MGSADRLGGSPVIGRRARRGGRWLAVSLAVCALSLPTRPLQAQGRTWIPAPLRSIGGVPPESPDLLDPLYLAATDTLLVVYDFGDYSVKAFRTDGRLAWRFGRIGHGPGEFEAVADMQLDSSGRLWLSDAGNLRMTILEPSGKMSRMVNLPGTVWSGIPVTGDTFFAKLPLRTPFYDVFGPDGKMISSLPIPAVLKRLDYNQAVQNAVSNSHGVIVSALRWSSRFFLIDTRTHAVRECEGIDSVPPAQAITQRIKVNGNVVVGHRIDPAAEAVIESVASDRDYAYLLIRGPTENARRIVDRHRLADCRYEGSYLLPTRAQQLARTRRGFAILVTDPTPRIEVLEVSPNP